MIKYQAMHKSDSLLINEDQRLSRIGTPQATIVAAEDIIQLQALRMFPRRPELQKRHRLECYIQKVEVADVKVRENA